MYGGVELQFHVFLTTALHRGEWPFNNLGVENIKHSAKTALLIMLFLIFSALYEGTFCCMTTHTSILFSNFCNSCYISMRGDERGSTGWKNWV